MRTTRGRLTRAGYAAKGQKTRVGTASRFREARQACGLTILAVFVDWLDQSGLVGEQILSIHGSARISEEQLETIRRTAR